MVSSSLEDAASSAGGAQVRACGPLPVEMGKGGGREEGRTDRGEQTCHKHKYINETAIKVGAVGQWGQRSTG